MSLNIFNALSFPYRRTNLLQAWLIPGTIVLVMEIVRIATLYALQSFRPDTPQSMLEGIQATIQMSETVLIFGFLWQMARNMQEQGQNAPLPSWWERLSSYVVSGIKLLPYLVLIQIVIVGVALLLPYLMSGIPQTDGLLYQGVSIVLVGILAIVLMAAFSIPMVQSAQSQSFLALFNLKRSLPIFRERYLKGLAAASIGLVVFIFYMSTLSFLIQNFDWAQYVLPYLMVSMFVTIWHLLSQALSPAQDISEQLPAVS